MPDAPESRAQPPLQDLPPPGYVGVAEIAALTGATVHLVEVWRFRGRLPAPEFRVGKSPLWTRQTIEDWIKSTSERRDKM